MHLTGIRFGRMPPFTTPVEIKFDARANVFVGANATGKSQLLSAIDEFFNKRAGRRPPPYTPDYVDPSLLLCREGIELGEWSDGRNLLWADTEFEAAMRGSETTPPVVYIEPTRIGLPIVSKLGDLEVPGSTADDVLCNKFSGPLLKVAIDKLYDKTRRMYQQEEQESIPLEERKAWRFLDVDKVTHACAMSICRELITIDRALNYPTGLDVEFLADQPMGNTEDIVINRMLGISTDDATTFSHIPPAERPIDTIGTEGKRIYVGDLSSGSQSTLLWIMWLGFTMLNHYDFAEGWNERPAVLLIDEVENHLHPTWQRRVIPALLEFFPRLQVFATTHSPFVVAGLRAGQVHMLQREEYGVITASTNERDIVGWTTDEILRSFMGVDEPTDQLTVDRANRLRDLREKDELDDAEVKELEDLRRKVNEDFMASSTPLEAQRERYGDMMLEFLRSRQSDLSQDGS